MYQASHMRMAEQKCSLKISYYIYIAYIDFASSDLGGAAELCKTMRQRTY